MSHIASSDIYEKESLNDKESVMPGKKFAIEPESISVRIGKSAIIGLRNMAVRESVRKGMNITVTDIVKESLKKSHPELFAL